MTKDQIVKKVLAYKDWEWWAERPFGAFIMSLFAHGEKREYYRSIGVDAIWPATLWQKGAFYQSNTVLDEFAAQLQKYLSSGGSVAKIVRECEAYGRAARKEIAWLNKSKLEPLEKLAQLYEILALDMCYVWLAHGLEHIYKKKLYKEVPKYVAADRVDKFIGDISYPIKKNAHHYLEEALRSSMPLAEVKEKFGWIKARDGFSDGFSIAELKKEREHLKKIKPGKFVRPKIPKQLESLAKIAQELVYYRTMRTDILYELMYQAQPIFKEVGKLYGIPYREFIDYSALDLIAGKPRKYPRLVTYVSYRGEFAFFDQPVLHEQYGELSEIRGLIANKGLVRGQAKIVKTAYQIDKVKQGDILFAPTTAPSFIIGMKKAAGFVTDEGGITSHAAIVSREMNKPCIIGTKIGTKIFKDGDMVEVDANKGIVRKI